MSRSLIRNLTQILVVLWLLIDFAKFLTIFVLSLEQSLLSDPSFWISLGLGGFLPIALAMLLIVTPTKSNKFFVPDRVEGSAAYLCAVLRGCLLIELTGISVLAALAVSFAFSARGVDATWIPATTLLAEFGSFVLLTWLAPWISIAVVRQVDSGVMWYTRAWQSLKGLLNPD